jgi:Icc-related predicted phosphoesterase
MGQAMRIQHISDTHGYFPDLKGDFDAVIHSGDFFANHSWGPNRHWSVLDMEKAWQTDWIKARTETIKEWLDGRPFLFCTGNHDFIDPCGFLQEAGLTAINLDNKVTEFEGKTLWGMPWVPFDQGAWSHELRSAELKAEVQRMLDAFPDSRPDILVAHAPPHGILDDCLGTCLGNPHLSNALNYTFDQLPNLVLCGHIHERYGIQKLGDCTISNGSVAHFITRGEPVPARILEL